MTTGEIEDTKAIEVFMVAAEQKIRIRPVADICNADIRNTDNSIPEADIKLRVEIITEELFELLAAMGFRIDIDKAETAAGEKQSYIISRHSDVATGKVYDSLETLDALGDLIYVIKGTGLALGMNIDSAVLDAIHPSNMSKFDSHGKPIKRDDGKLLKSEHYFTPTEKLKNILQNGR